MEPTEKIGVITAATATAPEWRLFRKRPLTIRAYRTAQPLLIETLEGVMRADEGDWVIEGVRGELYPCKPEIFEASYEPVLQQNS